MKIKKIRLIPLIALMLFFLCSQTFAHEKEVRLKEDETLKIIYDADGNYVVIEVLPNKQVIVKSNEVQTKYELPQDEYAFHDIKDHWGKEEIQTMVDIGLLKGYPDGTFKPNNTITRAEYGAILVRILELEYKRPLVEGENLFIDADIVKDAWHYSYLTKLQHNGNLQPSIYSNTLKPNKAITREEMALWLANDIEMGNNIINFSDKSSIIYKTEVDKAVSQGLLKGYPDGTFKPDALTTRAEAAVVFTRYMQSKDL